MILYLDTSAFLKLYVREPESRLVREAVSDAVLVCTHLITYVEMRAGFAKAQRLGRIARARLASLVGDLDRDWGTVEILGIEERLVHRAGELAERYGLRAYDSVHLASAEATRAFFPAEMKFCFTAFDTGLNAAAKGLGLPLLLP